MRKFLGGTVAFLVACSVVLGAASPARSECTTQGSLALALAQLVDPGITTAEAAARALAGVGVEPDGGWVLTECLTQAAIDQVTARYAQAVAENRHWGRGGLAAGYLPSALELIRPAERRYPGGTVSDVNPH